MRKCSQHARAQCPHGAYCEAFAVYADESECARFNEKVMREDDGPLADPYLVTAVVWIAVTDRKPQDFVSVLGCMTDAGDFPAVRECYTVDGRFFFPALAEFHPVSHWAQMPENPKGAKNNDTRR